MKSLTYKIFTAQVAAQINHTYVKQVVSVTEIAQVYEIALIAYKYGVAVLKVTMQGCV